MSKWFEIWAFGLEIDNLEDEGGWQMVFKGNSKAEAEEYKAIYLKEVGGNSDWLTCNW